MNTIRFHKKEDVKSISEFTIRDRVWFTYYNDIGESVRVVDKITGAALPKDVTGEKSARAFLIGIADEKLNRVISSMMETLKELSIEAPIN